MTFFLWPSLAGHSCQVPGYLSADTACFQCQWSVQILCDSAWTFRSRRSELFFCEHASLDCTTLGRLYRDPGQCTCLSLLFCMGLNLPLAWARSLASYASESSTCLETCPGRPCDPWILCSGSGFLGLDLLSTTAVWNCLNPEQLGKILESNLHKRYFTDGYQ